VDIKIRFVQVPIQLLNSLMTIKGFNRESFENVHASGETGNFDPS